MDENALQPAQVGYPHAQLQPKRSASELQVNTNWDWGHVHQADTYLEHLERMRDANVTSEQ
jgi:hypothetical protein